MTSVQYVTASVQVITQIKGIGEDVVGLEISLSFDANIVPRVGSMLIVKVNIILNAQPSDNQIVQYLPESAIVKGNGSTPSIITLEGLLWVKGPVEGIKVIEESGSIYYINSH